MNDDHFLLVFVACINGSTAAAEQNGVYLLTNENFESFINDHQAVLVMFDAPSKFNCSHCSKLFPEFESAANAIPHWATITDTPINTVFATIECNELLINKIRDVYQFLIPGYPTMAYFVNGKISKFSVGAYNHQDAKWIMRFVISQEMQVRSFSSLSTALCNEKIL